MYICSCHVVTDGQIRKHAQTGAANTWKELVLLTKCGTQCGRCAKGAKEIFELAKAEMCGENCCSLVECGTGCAGGKCPKPEVRLEVRQKARLEGRLELQLDAAPLSICPGVKADCSAERVSECSLACTGCPVKAVSDAIISGINEVLAQVPLPPPPQISALATSTAPGEIGVE